MEMHHRLRRDPNWHPSACNICGQLGHQAANCTNGTINWKQIYGDESFIIRRPIYWSEVVAKKKAKEVDIADLQRRAREWAAEQAAKQGVSYEAIQEHGKQAAAAAVAPAAPAADPEPDLPAGWAVAHDAAGRPYYWHKKTQKTQWDRPTEESAAG